jgi:hypothetical protein
MSGARSKWEATRYEQRDDASNLYMIVSKSCGAWDWMVSGPGFCVAAGTSISLSMAQHDARAALRKHKSQSTVMSP